MEYTFKITKRSLMICSLLITIGSWIVFSLYNQINIYAYESHQTGSNVYNGYGNFTGNWYNDNLTVSSNPMITVLTHGLGGGVEHWSNNFGNTTGTAFGFAYDNRSMIEQLRSNAPNGATVFWAQMKSTTTFQLMELPVQGQLVRYYPADSKDSNVIKLSAISRLTTEDLQKHIIIVFDSTGVGSVGTNDAVYSEFKTMLNSIIYDVVHLTGGTYPKINLIGHSRGGLTNMQYALDYPRLVDGLFSLGTPYLGTTSGSVNKLFGYPIVSESPGFEDILDATLFKSYRNTWNTNSGGRYSHINVLACGGYSNLPFLSAMINNDPIENFTSGQRTALQLVFNGINTMSIPLALLIAANPDTSILALATNLVTDLVTNALQGLFPDSDIIAFIHLLTTELEYNITLGTTTEFPFITVDMGIELKNDLFVDLDSQFGRHPSGNYQRFETLSKKFTSSADYSLVSERNMPIVHNLEARDPYFISEIVSRINLGTFPPFSLYNIPGTNNTRIENFAYKNYAGPLTIPATINGRNVTEIVSSAFSGCNKLTSITREYKVHTGTSGYYNLTIPGLNNETVKVNGTTITFTSNTANIYLAYGYHTFRIEASNITTILNIPSINPVLQASLNTSYLGQADKDNIYWYRFTATTAGVYDFETTGTGATTGELFDSVTWNGWVVARLVLAGSGSGSGNNFKITYYLNANQTIYIRVTGNQTTNPSSFSFKVTSNTTHTNHVHQQSGSPTNHFKKCTVCGHIVNCSNTATCTGSYDSVSHQMACSCGYSQWLAHDTYLVGSTYYCRDCPWSGKFIIIQPNSLGQISIMFADDLIQRVMSLEEAIQYMRDKDYSITSQLEVLYSVDNVKNSLNKDKSKSD